MFLVFFSDWYTAGLLWFEPSTKFVFKRTHTNLWLTINKTFFSTQQTLAFQHQTMSLTARVFMPRTWEVHDPNLCFHHEIMLVSSTRTMLLSSNRGCQPLLQYLSHQPGVGRSIWTRSGERGSRDMPGIGATWSRFWPGDGTSPTLAWFECHPGLLG